MTPSTMRLLTGLAGLLVAAGAYAQSTVGELLEKGGKQRTKEEFLSSMPFQLKWEWPNRQGEEELVLYPDGKITGSGYHFQTRTTSPAEGTWKLEDDGKLCASKTFSAWNRSTSACWYSFVLDNVAFASLNSEPGSKLIKVSSIAKLPAESK